MRQELGGARQEFSTGNFLTPAAGDVRYVRLAPGVNTLQSVTGRVKLTQNSTDAFGVYTLEITNLNPLGQSQFGITNDDGSRQFEFFCQGSAVPAGAAGFSGPSGFWALPNTSVLNSYHQAWQSAGLAFFALNPTTQDFGGGRGLFNINNADAAPTAAPASGVLFYTDPADGRLYAWRHGAALPAVLTP